MQKELKYLGYLLTNKRAKQQKPQEKKVEAMRRIKTHTNLKQLKQFLGMVNFYTGMTRMEASINSVYT